jgi:SAM-dependent methyltransferase
MVLLLGGLKLLHDAGSPAGDRDRGPSRDDNERHTNRNASSGKDWVVKGSAQRRFFERLSSRFKDFRVFPDAFHDLVHERDRFVAIEQARTFFLNAFEQPPVPAPSRPGNQARYEELRKPLSPLSPASWFWGAQRIFLSTVGRLSQGIRVGWKTGFDSGESLDYVYRNKAEGTTPLGKMIDAIYLESPGWNGIRVRRANLEQLLGSVMRKLHHRGTPVHILDIATGHGRYVLETLQRNADIPASALLRDWDERNVQAGRALANRLCIPDVEFRQGDAFDPDSLAAIGMRPSIAIVSGLYELFPDNEMVQRSLDAVSRELTGPGYLIYTNQPWHPQLDMIARVLINRDHKPWVMRCRAQAEMDELVRRAGFEKLDMLTDENGIFTVSVARKKA